MILNRRIPDRPFGNQIFHKDQICEDVPFYVVYLIIMRTLQFAPWKPMPQCTPFQSRCLH